MQSREVVSFDSNKIHTVFVPAAAETKGTILWVHGAFEHIGRFAGLMQYMASLGYQSIGYDHRGHGKSGGVRCYIGSFDEYLKDLTAVYQAYEKEVAGNLFLVGHSMGGLVAVRYLEEYPAQIPFKKAVLSSPFLGVKAKVAAWKKIMSKLVVSIYPQLAVPNDLDPSVISHDSAQVELYRKDPLVLKKATAGWFEEIVKNLELAHLKAGQIQTELHILYALGDLLVEPGDTDRFYRKLNPALTKSITSYAGFYHEIFNELERDKPIAALVDILGK